MASVITLRPDPVAALRTARAAPDPPATAGWLDAAPDNAHWLHRVQHLPKGAALEACGRELLAWGVHRRAGLRVLADGEAAIGANVVLHARIGPLAVLAPCRVTDMYSGPDRIGFVYTTLPGHPEEGAERFEFSRNGGEVRFEVTAVSLPAFWGSRLLPFAARQVQAIITERYLRAALEIATAAQ